MCSSYSLTHTSLSCVCVVPALFLSALHAVFVCSAADERETTGHSPVSALLHSVMHKNIKTFVNSAPRFQWSFFESLTVSLCCCCSAKSCSFKVWFSLCAWERDRKCKYSVVDLLKGSFHALFIISYLFLKSFKFLCKKQPLFCFVIILHCWA